MGAAAVGRDREGDHGGVRWRRREDGRVGGRLGDGNRGGSAAAGRKTWRRQVAPVTAAVRPARQGGRPLRARRRPLGLRGCRRGHHRGGLVPVGRGRRRLAAGQRRRAAAGGGGRR